MPCRPVDHLHFTAASSTVPGADVAWTVLGAPRESVYHVCVTGVGQSGVDSGAGYVCICIGMALILWLLSEACSHRVKVSESLHNGEYDPRPLRVRRPVMGERGMEAVGDCPPLRVSAVLL